MSAPYVVVTVNHTPGERLPSGTPSGIGGKTTYGVALTTNGLDRQPVAGVEFTAPKEAHRYAERLERRLAQEHRA